MTQRTTPTAQVRHLLYLLEVMQQILEVKLETLYEYPRFLRATLQRVKSSRSMDTVTTIGERVVVHVKELHSLITDLGGHPEQDFLPDEINETRDALTAFTFQEALALRMLEECRTLVVQAWPASTLKQWMLERLTTLLTETQEHSTALERIFARTEPRYRDSILERFRVAAIP